MVLSSFDGRPDDRKEMEEKMYEEIFNTVKNDNNNGSAEGGARLHPQTNSTAQLDLLLSKELLQLSLQDRNAITEEIHGVQTLAPEETPEMLTTALDDLAKEISFLQKKAAFDVSQEYPNTYVNSADFRLRFLRCDLFDTKKAAERMVQFLDLLYEVFGDYALRRPIQMSDFTREEMQVFRAGHYQLLPYRDRSGRRVFASVGGFGIRYNLVTRVSCFDRDFLLVIAALAE